MALGGPSTMPVPSSTGNTYKRPLLTWWAQMLAPATLPSVSPILLGITPGTPPNVASPLSMPMVQNVSYSFRGKKSQRNSVFVEFMAKSPSTGL